MLEGKQATIIIKEKDGIIKGSAGAVLPVLEITEEQMEQKATSGEVPGTEKTQFTGTVRDNLVKIPIHLRPKSDEELKKWKDKLSKGKEDGTYTYTFAGSTSMPSGDERRRIAGVILTNAKEGKKGNPKIETGKTAYIEDIIDALEKDRYLGDEKITFKLYKKEPELLYVQAKAQGQKQHDKEILKKEGEYFEIGKTKAIIFPFKVKPENDINGIHKRFYWAGREGSQQATFNGSRGSIKHAGRDLYSKPYTEVVDICGGKVLHVSTAFAYGTGAITILHETNDGRKFIIRYGEVENETVLVKKDDLVRQGDTIGKTGFLRGIYKRVVPNYEIYMLHFEYYTGALGFDLNKPLSDKSAPYNRRGDLADPLSILEEGYRNTFEEQKEESNHLFTLEDGKKALRVLYNKYKNMVWNWKWDGSENEVRVTGVDVLKIVEKMYRTETSHFTSGQYQNCGTGGMEVFGSPHYYGWDSSLFIEQPIGTWSAFEGKGLSGNGGNEQVTNRKKEFVKLPSVLAGMEYKIKYIIKYNGNYARWYNSKNIAAQNTYRTELRGVRARFIQEFINQ